MKLAHGKNGQMLIPCTEKNTRAKQNYICGIRDVKMRKAKVIGYTKPKKYRGRIVLRLLPFIILIFLKMAITISPILIIAYYINIYGMPYMLWEYSYYGSKEHPHITFCTYIGYDGARSFPANECPFIDFIEDRNLF